MQLRCHRDCCLHVTEKDLFIFPSLQRHYLDHGIYHNFLCSEFPFSWRCLYAHMHIAQRDFQRSEGVVSPVASPSFTLGHHVAQSHSHSLSLSPDGSCHRAPILSQCQEERMKRSGRVPGNLNHAGQRKNQKRLQAHYVTPNNDV